MRIQRERFTVSVPTEIKQMLDVATKLEGTTRSMQVQEALRQKFSK